MAENENLKDKLKERCELIKELSCDLKNIKNDLLFCMIFETYQRFCTQINHQKGLAISNGDKQLSLQTATILK